MKIRIISDNERYILKLSGYVRDNDIGAFDHYLQVCTWQDVKERVYSVADIVFIDSDQGSKEALDYIQEVKTKYPGCYMVLTSDDISCAMDAYRLHADGFIMKPLDEDAVAGEIANYIGQRRNLASQDEEDSAQKDQGLYIRTGKEFECFGDGKPIHFSRTRTKELLKYLTDHPNRMICNSEIMAQFWDKETISNKSHFRMLVSELVNLFVRYGRQDEIVKFRGQIGYFPRHEVVKEIQDSTAEPLRRSLIRQDRADIYLAAGAERY